MKYKLGDRVDLDSFDIGEFNGDEVRSCNVTVVVEEIENDQLPYKGRIVRGKVCMEWSGEFYDHLWFYEGNVAIKQDAL